jgi:hypothetical protein
MGKVPEKINYGESFITRVGGKIKAFLFVRLCQSETVALPGIPP